MGSPELGGSTLARPNGSRAAPHQHGPIIDDGATDGRDAALVAMSIALQDGCLRCVRFHAAEAGRRAAPRLQVLEALGTALLLSTPHAERWPRLAEAALDAHDEVTS
jgi:AhpD family alkylhydroperoxidase